MKKILVLLVLAVFSLSFASHAWAGSFGITLENPLCRAGTSSCTNDFPGLIARVSTFFTGIIGTLSIIMFVWAGILFVTSAGNPGKIDKAKQAMWWAIVGVAIVLGAAGLEAVIRAVIGQAPA